MDVSKIIRGIVNSRGYTITSAITQWDYGYAFVPEFEDMPATYRLDFSNDEHHGTALPVYCGSEGGEVPEELIDTGKDIFVWFFYIGDGFGQSEYKWRIPNKCKPKTEQDEPTPSQQSSIDQLIVRSNEAVTSAEQSASNASQSARSASDDADRAERARTGAETAQGKAEDAQESAERAKDDAETSERNASESERKAKGYAENASEKADSIHSMTTSAQTLPAGSSATASYDAETGVMSFGIPKGKDGIDGIDGDDGYSPTANVSKSGKTATITITDKNGTTSAQVSDGTDGIDGISPSVSVTDITGGHRVVITDKDGAKSFDVEDGATGATPNLTIGTVETLEPTESATASITGTPENPVLNLGIPQGEQGEVTTEEFLKAFVTDTASGSIASFTDGADDLPLKSLVVDINPVQDLHGQDAPYPAGGGKNKLASNVTEDVPVSTIVFSITKNVAEITIDSDLTAGMGYRFNDGSIEAVLPAGDYYLSSNITNQNSGGGFFIFDALTSTILGRARAEGGARISLSAETTVRLGMALSAATKAGTYWFQLEAGTTHTAYAPYENICPISGWTSVDVEQRAENLFDVDNLETFLIGTKNYNGHTFSKAGKYAIKTYAVGDAEYIYARLKNADGTLSSNYYIVAGTTHTDQVITVEDGQTLLVFHPIDNRTQEQSKAVFNAWKLLVAYGESYPVAFTPYTGRSITIPLGQTVYGGHIDVLGGNMVISMVKSALPQDSVYQANNNRVIYLQSKFADVPKISGVVVSNAFKYYPNTSTPPIWNVSLYSNGNIIFGIDSSVITNNTEWDTFVSENDVYVVYELAEPIEIQLTPQQVNSLLGVNNIWADSGDTEIEYRADTKLYISKKIAEALASLT